MNKIIGVSAIIAALLFLPMGASYELNGTLTDCNGLLAGVTITLNHTGNTTTTDSAGFWSFGTSASEDDLLNGTYLVTMTPMSASWYVNTTTLTVADDNADNALSMGRSYCASFAVADIPNQVVDFIGGILSALAGASNPLVWAIVAGIVIGLVGAIVFAVKRLGK